MKLLLTSAGLQNKKVSDFFISVLPKKPSDLSVLMVAFAQNDIEQHYIDESKKELIELGIKNATVFNLKEEKFESERDYDAIYVCGGNTFSILNRIRTVGIDKFIIDAVKNKGTLYIGVSAGSIIAGPSIEIAGWGSEGDKNDIGLTDFTGFGLTDIAVFPHFTLNQKEEVESFKNKVKYPIIELTDEEAVYVENDKTKVIK